jgi:hypothetical protein
MAWDREGLGTNCGSWLLSARSAPFRFAFSDSSDPQRERRAPAHENNRLVSGRESKVLRCRARARSRKDAHSFPVAAAAAAARRWQRALCWSSTSLNGASAKAAASFQGAKELLSANRAPPPPPAPRPLQTGLAATTPPPGSVWPHRVPGSPPFVPCRYFGKGEVKQMAFARDALRVCPFEGSGFASCSAW